MRKVVSVLLSLLILAAVAAGALRAADALQYSLFTYQSPLSVTHLEPGDPMPSQTGRVVIVVVGGLGDAVVGEADMPNLERLFEAGASAPMTSRPPTYSLPAWTALLSGAWPELNHAPILKAHAASPRPLAVDHLFAAARDAGLRTAIAATEEWASLLPAGTADASFYASDEEAMADAQVAQAAFGFLADPQYNLILIYFGQMDVRGQSQGVNSPAYLGAARQIDNHLRQVTRLVDMSDSVLIVTSDHGLTPEGQVGGDEPDLTELPFVAIGQHIVPGAYSPVHQVDLAPTVAALLGTRPPAASQGRPLYELLQTDQATQTLGQLQLARQKAALADAYVMAMGGYGLSRATREDLTSAQQAFLDGNQAGALELARLVADEASAEMQAARQATLARQRWPRLAVVGLGLLLWLIVLRWRRGRHTLFSLVAGGVAVALYYALYRLRGYTFSLSAVDQVDPFFTLLVTHAVLGTAAGGLVLWIGLLYRDERRWSEALLAGYDYGLWGVLLGALPALYGYWQHGATLGGYLPDLGSLLVHFMALVQVGVLAGLGMLLPWLVALLAWGMGRWRTYAEARARAWQPAARLRHR